MKTGEIKPILFKVLDKNMNSTNGGKLHWELGKWHIAKGQLKICQNGLHLTTRPEKWHTTNLTRIFLANARGIKEWQNDKCVCRKVQLIIEVPQKIWTEFKPKRDALDAEFKPKRDALYAEFNTKRDALYAEFKPKRDALYAEFKPKRDALDAEFKSKWDALDAEFKPKWDALDAELVSIVLKEGSKCQT